MKREPCLLCERLPAEEAGLCLGCQTAVSLLLLMRHSRPDLRQVAEAVVGAQLVLAKVGRPQAEDYLRAQLRQAGGP